MNLAAGIRHLEPGEEFECDRAYVTDDAVFVRINGVWTKLVPFKYEKAQSPIETNKKGPS